MFVCCVCLAALQQEVLLARASKDLRWEGRACFKVARTILLQVRFRVWGFEVGIIRRNTAVALCFVSRKYGLGVRD